MHFTMSQVIVSEGYRDCPYEHFDGNGYPMGLKGYPIPMEVRIVMIADMFDALLSKRLYKQVWTIYHAVTYMKTQVLCLTLIEFKL